ncbi:MAG TPA: hypothetical protein VHT91_50505 [Kofleriaceae bacterium]|nr:hypothetical protein [Kofleriaceae bacterium]
MSALCQRRLVERDVAARMIAAPVSHRVTASPAVPMVIAILELAHQVGGGCGTGKRQR